MMDFVTLLEQAPAGPRIEFGVCNGATVRLMAKHPGRTLGTDSFEGMGESGPRDLTPEGIDQYPKGRLKADFDEVRRTCPGIELIRGWVPEVFDTDLASAGPFAFAHVDMDHYGPTRDAVQWLWSRMLPGGIICCDDWFEGKDILASAFLNDWALRFPFAGTFGRKCWWVR